MNLAKRVVNRDLTRLLVDGKRIRSARVGNRVVQHVAVRVRRRDGRSHEGALRRVLSHCPRGVGGVEIGRVIVRGRGRTHGELGQHIHLPLFARAVRVGRLRTQDAAHVSGIRRVGGRSSVRGTRRCPVGVSVGHRPVHLRHRPLPRSGASTVDNGATGGIPSVGVADRSRQRSTDLRLTHDDVGHAGLVHVRNRHPDQYLDVLGRLFLVIGDDLSGPYNNDVDVVRSGVVRVAREVGI